MSRVRYSELLARNSHPSDEDLVALVSHEGSPDAAEQIQKHLDSCWHCQARHEEFKQGIIDIVQNLNAYVGDLSSRSRVAKIRLDQELRRLAADREKPVPFTQLLEMLNSPLPSRFLIRQFAFVAAGVLIFLTIFPFTSQAPISAAEFLLRSKQAEQEMFHAVPNPTLHGRFRVTKKTLGSGHEQSMTWEIWNDTVHNRVKNRVQEEEGVNLAGAGLISSPQAVCASANCSALLRELQQVFSMNGIDPAYPLSPAGFDKWRQSLSGERDEVFATPVAGRGTGMGVRTIPAEAPSEGCILSAELIVRTEDWHPVEQRFTVQRADSTQEYDVLETAYQVVSLESAPPAIFAETRILPVQPRRLHVTPPAGVPTAEQLDDAELSAKFTLHHVDEFLRGQIYVKQDASSLVKIEGLVDSDQRKAELSSLLESIPYTVVRIRTTEEVLNDLHASSPETAGPVSVSPQRPAPDPDSEAVKRNQEWVQAQWVQYGKRFQGIDSHEIDQRMVEISNQAIARTRAASLQAWALRRLAQDYPPQRVSGLNVRSKWLLETMVQDHMRWLQAEIAQLNSLVNPVLSSFAVSAGRPNDADRKSAPMPSSGAASTWQEQVGRLFQSVEDIDDQALGVFGNVALVRGSAADAVNNLLTLLPQFKADAQDFEQQVSNGFADMGESPAMQSSMKRVP